jgi:hypothetical protein
LRHSPVLVSHVDPVGQSELLLHLVMQTSKSSAQTTDEPTVDPPAQSSSVRHWQIFRVSVVLIAAQFLALSGQSVPAVQVRTQISASG